MWNDVQQDFQHRTLMLEQVATQRVPGLFQGAFLFDWEQKYLAVNRAYRALTQHDDFAVCAAWEAQEITGLASDATDIGAHFTQPWEAYMDLPGEPVRSRWPRNLNTVLFIAYDDDAIGGTTKKVVQSRDSSYLQTQGSPTCFYQWDQDDFVLYPRPSVAFANEIEGTVDGGAWFADGDTEDTSTGTLATRTASYDTGQGVTVDIIDSADNLFLVYRASPTDVEVESDESDFPPFVRKYIAFGVIARAYSANTDGRIRSLGELWAARYELGVGFARRYLRNRRQDRDYRLTIGRGRTASRHPKLPDTYPEVSP